VWGRLILMRIGTSGGLYRTEVARPTESSVMMYQAIRRYISEEGNLYSKIWTSIIVSFGLNITRMLIGETRNVLSTCRVCGST
jgi:hypothetical protein